MTPSSATTISARARHGDGDDVLVARAAGAQRVGERARALVELGVGQHDVLADDRRSVGVERGAALERRDPGELVDVARRRGGELEHGLALVVGEQLDPADEPAGSDRVRDGVERGQQARVDVVRPRRRSARSPPRPAITVIASPAAGCGASSAHSPTAATSSATLVHGRTRTGSSQRTASRRGVAQADRRVLAAVQPRRGTRPRPPPGRGPPASRTAARRRRARRSG